MRAIKILIILSFALAVRSSAQTDTVWQRFYGDQPFNYGVGVIQMHDRGYVFLLNESNIAGDGSIHLLNTDSLGIIRWDKQIEDTSLCWANDFKRTSDGGFVITGYTYQTTQKSYDVLLIKTDSLGQIEWESTVGGTDWDMAQAVSITPDSGFIVVGQTYSFGAGNGNIYVLKFNSIGDTLWTRVLGGDSLDFASSVDITADSNYLVGANTQSYGKGGMDVWVIKYSKAGDTLWSRFYGDTLDDRLYSIKVTHDKGFVWSGCTRSYGGVGLQGWLERVDSNGNFMWKLPEFWEIGAGDNVTSCITLNDSAQYVVTGYSNGIGAGGYDYVIAVLLDWHIFRFDNTFGTTKDDEAIEAIQTYDKGYIIVGTTYGGGPSNTNLFVVKTKSDCKSTDTILYTTGIREYISNNKNSVRIYPNPSDGVINIDINSPEISEHAMIKVYDFSGACIMEYYSDGKSFQGAFTIDLSGKAPGLYLVNILSGEQRWTKKIIIR